jgi:hypothetical protein
VLIGEIVYDGDGIADCGIDHVRRPQRPGRGESLVVDVNGDDRGVALRGRRCQDEGADPSDADQDDGLAPLSAAAPQGVDSDRQRLGESGSVIRASIRHRAAHPDRDASELSEAAAGLKTKSVVACAEIRPTGLTPLTRAAPHARAGDNALAPPDLVYVRANRDDTSDEFVTQDERTLMAAARVSPSQWDHQGTMRVFGRVGAADGRATDPQKSLARARLTRVGDRLDANVSPSVIHRCLHQPLLRTPGRAR